MIVRVGMSRGRRAQRPWYVDSVNGSDANRGKSPSDALRTIAAVMPKIKARDAVALARGSHWREMFAIPAGHVRVMAYGNGARPLLDCSDAIPASGWTKTAGQTNVYEATVGLDGTDNAQFVSAWESDLRLVRAASVAECDTTPGSYFTYADNAPSITLYVHASDGSDPSSSGKTYEYSRRQFGLIGGNYIDVQGIQTRRNLHCNGSLSIYANGSLTDCVASEGCKHNVYVGPGSTLTNVEADRGYYTGDALMFVHNGASLGDGNVTYVNCYAHDFSGPTASGFGGHSNDGSRFGTVHYQGCNVVNCTRGFDSADAGVTQLTGSTTANPNAQPNAAGLWTNSPSVLVTGSTLVGRAGSGRAIQVDGGDASVTVRDSTLMGNTGFFQSGPNVSLVLENCTVSTDGFCIYSNGSGFVLHSSGNTFQSPLVYYYCDKGGTVDSDYNTFIDPGVWARFELPAGTRLNLEQWKASGQDVHSQP
jgi:hypothetical protein